MEFYAGDDIMNDNEREDSPILIIVTGLMLTVLLFLYLILAA